ncbi:MAG: hypothetical protein R3C69_08005 [Geminicoccaceae bacterium]
MTQDQMRVDDALDNDRLLRFVDGALDDDQRVQVLTALSSRPETVAKVEAYLHQNARLRALGQHLPMHDSRTFRADLQGEIVRRLAGRRTRATAFRYAAAAAVALTVLAGGTALTLDRLTGSGTSLASRASSAPEIYFPFGTTQLAASEPSGTAAPSDATPTDLASITWLAGQVPGLSLSAPELDGIGLHLVRGETLDTNRAPAIRLIYADEVSATGRALCRRRPLERRPRVPSRAQEGHLSLQWRRRPMIFALVAPTDSPQLSAIVELVGKGVAQAQPREATEPAPAAAPADGGPRPVDRRARGAATPRAAESARAGRGGGDRHDHRRRRDHATDRARHGQGQRAQSRCSRACNGRS